MGSATPLSIAVALAAGLAGCVSLRAPALHSLDLDQWLEIRSDRFSILTNAPRREGERLGRQLVGFEAAVRAVTGLDRIPALPVRIFLFRTPDQRTHFGAAGVVLGFALPTLRGEAIVASAEPPDLANQTLYHEYTHHLLWNAAGITYPSWYHEGLAELFSSTHVRGGAAWLGAVPPLRVETLDAPPLPIELLLAARSPFEMQPEEALRYYTDAWLLVHYLSLGSYRGAPQRERLVTFLRLLDRGQSWRDAFDAAFEMGLPDLERELVGHRRKLALGVRPLRLELASFETRVWVRPVSRDEAAHHLALLAVELGELRLAQDLLAETLAAVPEHPGALAALALARAAAGEPARGLPPAGRALELDAEEPVAHEAMGSIHLALAAAQPDRASAHVERARAAYRRATELAPDLPSAWAGRAQAYLAGEPDRRAAIDALERARARLGWKPDLDLQLAELYLNLDRPEAARPLLRRVANSAHDEAMARRALEALRALADDATPSGPGVDYAPPPRKERFSGPIRATSGASFSGSKP